MAPTIIVGDDENAGDVAARLLDLADRQKDVRTRTDLAQPAFDVPDAVYAKYIGRHQRPDDERRVNAVAKMQADDDAATAITTGDELPDAARVADPGDVDASIAGPIEGDELPDAAKVVDPTTTTTGDGDQGDEQPADKPKPARKRAPRKAAAKKTTPAAAAGGGE